MFERFGTGREKERITLAQTASVGGCMAQEQAEPTPLVQHAGLRKPVQSRSLCSSPTHAGPQVTR
jgi:hypothetical protein